MARKIRAGRRRNSRSASLVTKLASGLLFPILARHHFAPFIRKVLSGYKLYILLNKPAARCVSIGKPPRLLSEAISVQS
jgi:hypothetical protein